MSWSGALALFNPRFPRFSSVESPPESRSFLSSNFTSAPLSCCWLARSLLFSVLGAFRLEKRRLRSPDDRNSGVVEFDARKLDFVTRAARFFVSRRENAPPSELQLGQPGVQCHFVFQASSHVKSMATNYTFLRLRVARELGHVSFEIKWKITVLK